METFNFKKFTKTGSKLGNYKISYNNSSRSFGFNSGFYNKENIIQFKKVVLYFDSLRKAVAFEFTNDEMAEGAFTILHGKGSGSVSVHSFITENNLDKKEYSGKKDPKEIKIENNKILWVIQLENRSNMP